MMLWASSPELALFLAGIEIRPYEPTMSAALPV
jgi:hypothetical protein